MIDTDDPESPVLICPVCGWTGHREQLADDGPGHEWCCPACGQDIEQPDKYGEIPQFGPVL